MDKINVGIIGGAGYTAGELLRILLNHPNVAVIEVQSESQSGKAIEEIHADLLGTGLSFVANVTNKVDAIFSCKGHGESKRYLDAHPELLKLKIIDLSQDYRLKGTAEDFVYGLPELNRKQILGAAHVANPGCFATCIQLAILPAVKNKLVKGDLHISGITGSTGAGQSLSQTSHFSWRSNNASVYKALTHQHLHEIGESVLQEDEAYAGELNFIPYRGAFTRGIITTCYFETDATEEELKKAYADYFEGHPFTHVTNNNPDLKMVVNTNNAVVYTKKEGNKAIAISIIDNLLKGASGQAVQNMNLICGFAETAGLKLKGTGF